jgi:uncharacterized Zn finger protein
MACTMEEEDWTTAVSRDLSYLGGAVQSECSCPIACKHLVSTLKQPIK